MTNGERFRMRRRFQLVLQDPFTAFPRTCPWEKASALVGGLISVSKWGCKRQVLKDLRLQLGLDLDLSPN